MTNWQLIVPIWHSKLLMKKYKFFLFELLQGRNLQLMELLLFLAKIYAQIPRLPVGMYALISLVIFYSRLEVDFIVNILFGPSWHVILYQSHADWVLPPVWCSIGIFNGPRASRALCKNKGSCRLQDRRCMYITWKFIISQFHLSIPSSWFIWNFHLPSVDLSMIKFAFNLICKNLVSVLCFFSLWFPQFWVKCIN